MLCLYKSQVSLLASIEFSFLYTIYDSNFLAYNDKKKQLKLFIEENDIDNVLCIAINTCYTNQLIKSKHKLKSINPDVVLTDHNLIPVYKPYVANKQLHKLIKNIVKYGSVVFETYNPFDVFDYICILDSLNYCKYCNIANLYKIDFYKIKEDIVMVAYIAAERAHDDKL
jgi:hypothetical protein